MVVLVVEDEPLVRDDLVDWIEDEGYEVLTAANADQAIAILDRRRDIHAVITDVQMPGSMDGIRLAHHVRKRFPPTLLLIASGGVRPKLEDLPEDAVFLPKPFNPSQIVRLIANHPA